MSEDQDATQYADTSGREPPEIGLEPHVEAIKMPDNLRVGLMLAHEREACARRGCHDDFYALAFGQSPFHVPPSLSRALGNAATHGHYSDAAGIGELREAVADFNTRHFGLEVDPSRIFIGPGTKDLFHILFDVVAGDIVIPSPSWIGYSPQITLLDKRFHVLRLDPKEGYRLQPEALDSFLALLPAGQYTLVLNNPHNPTGVVYSAQELEAIAEVCRRHHTLVLADEIYALTTYDFESFVSMGRIYPEGTFVTNGISKDRSAGGYRLGSCIMPERCSDELKAAFTKVAATVYTNVSTPTQFAAIEVYEPNPHIEHYFSVCREIHRMMGSFLSREFNSIEGIRTTTPAGAFYFFADFNELADDLIRRGVAASNDLAGALIEHPHHLAVVTGDACLLASEDFGARIAFVDYDGKAAFADYEASKPHGPREEDEFVRRNAPRMVAAVDALQNWVDWVRAESD